jgi:hypothetical protein
MDTRNRIPAPAALTIILAPVITLGAIIAGVWSAGEAAIAARRHRKRRST